MPRSEAQRRADAAYRQRNAEKIKAENKYISIFLPAETAKKFKARCAENGDTMNAILRAAVEEYISK